MEDSTVEGGFELSKKLVSLLAAASMQVSSVVGAGYRQAVNRTLNPNGFEQARVLYHTLGWHVAAFLTVPLLGMLVYGVILGEYERENFWLVLILGFVLAVAVAAAFPLTFIHF